MSRVIRLVAAAVAAVFAAAVATPPAARAASGDCSHAEASAAAVPAPAVGSAVRCLVNAERAHRGLAPLKASALLRVAAAAHSADMVAHSFFDHVSPGGATLSDRARKAGYSGRTLGEDIGWGTYELGTPEAIVRAWMNSAPHRAIILNTRFREIGVGVAVGTPTDLTADGAVYTLDVGRR